MCVLGVDLLENGDSDRGGVSNMGEERKDNQT